MSNIEIEYINVYKNSEKSFIITSMKTLNNKKITELKNRIYLLHGKFAEFKEGNLPLSKNVNIVEDLETLNYLTLTNFKEMIDGNKDANDPFQQIFIKKIEIIDKCLEIDNTIYEQNQDDNLTQLYEIIGILNNVYEILSLSFYSFDINELNIIEQQLSKYYCSPVSS